MSGLKILVLEDEAFIAHDIKQILDNEGYITIVDCFDVDTAVNLYHLHHPDLVLIDINLNDKKNGIDFARYVKSIGQVPFIFVTSYSDKGTLSKVAGLSPSGYIIKPFKPQDLLSAVFLALDKVSSDVAVDASEKSRPFAITQALNYISVHLKEKLDVHTLASTTGWDTDHFSRLFKEYTGLTPYQFILKSRIELSKELLLGPKEKLHSICYEIGFSNYSNFFNAFKKYTGMSPEQYRKITLKDGEFSS